MITLDKFISSKPKSLQFLWNHPKIMKRVYDEVIRQYGDSRSLVESKLEMYHYNRGGSFLWSDSKEGYMFWNEIISFKKIEVFYKLYPKNKNMID